MRSIDQPTETVTTERRYIVNPDRTDRVHWSAILAGLVVTLSTQLLLSGLGSALGFTTIANSGAPRSDAAEVATAVGTWAIISLFISLFIGGWVTSRAYQRIDRSTATLNGAILWATALALSAWLLASGVSGAFGVAANAAADNASSIATQARQSGATLPNPATGTTGTAPQVNPPTAQQTRQIADAGAKTGWAFTIGSLLGLGAAIFGANLGARNHRRGDRMTAMDN
jgi:H+/gluconate symporter-like permease